MPHVAVLAGEPMPSLIASLAMGTGAIDGVCHIALSELQAAVAQGGNAGSRESIAAMVEGRMRDLADLPFHLIA